MTTAIISNTPAFQPLLSRESKAQESAEIKAAGMDSATLAALVAGLAAQMVVDTGKTAVHSLVNLRAPAIPLSEASALLSGIMSKLPTMLAQLAGASDPVKTEAGTEARLAEAAAATVMMRGVGDAQGDTGATQQPNGIDADAADRSANMGAWIQSSPFANLLTLLRQLLLKFEAMDRRNGSQMVIMQREMTIVAGERGIQKARENLGGAIGATLLTGAIGGAALKQSMKSTSMQTDSNIRHQNTANGASVGAAGQSHATKAAGLPSAQHRAARNVDGDPVKSSGTQGSPAADLQDDASSYTSEIKTAVNEVSAYGNSDALQAAHAYRMAESQIPASNAVMLNMMAPSIGGTISAGVQIEAETTEAERQLMLNVAETLKRVADAHQDQQMKNRDMREATTQMLESLMNLIASTSSHIIQKS
ncbi:hypothetical protein [Stenotrophomonas sp. 278]|uniref:hypothetical protein n=1 Tax=Stenotrophomonas sp. 278 TaxID=2479851 RepID=UPI000F67BAE2|nr:hypothetical protein [Stenotrophomonas sp. 278]RRU21172.1 hypothetical protein EGJ34_04480 [Stenotrophomonas sp. 278]